MFLRFSKGKFDGETRNYTKCVFLGDTLIMEYDNKIVGVAKLHEETDKSFDYDVIVATKAELTSEQIARNIKNMIGKSNKFSSTPSTKRRKYYVEKIDSETIPVVPRIVFSKA